MSEGSSWGWSSTATLGLLCVSILLAAAFVFAELRVAAPLINMHVFVRRPVLLTNITAVIAGFASFSVFALVPRFLETPTGLSTSLASAVDYGFGASATRAGFYLVPMSIMLLVAGPVAGVIGRRWGSKWPLTVGMALLAVGCCVLATWHERPWQIVLAMVVLGIGVGFAYASMPALISEAVSQTETGVATGINTVMRTIGAVIGGQVGASILTSSTIERTSIPAENAYTAVFVVASAAAVVGALVAAFIVRNVNQAAVSVQTA